MRTTARRSSTPRWRAAKGESLTGGRQSALVGARGASRPLWLDGLVRIFAQVGTRCRLGVAGLAVAEENRLGYDRELFPHWVDEDRRVTGATPAERS